MQHWRDSHVIQNVIVYVTQHTHCGKTTFCEILHILREAYWL